MTTHDRIETMEKEAETVVDKAQDAAAQVGEEAKQKLNETTNAAKIQAKRMAGRAGETAKTTVESRKGDVASEISSVADVVRQTTYEVGAGTSPTIENYGRRIADQLEGISSYVNENGVEEMLADAQELGRRRPVVFLGGAFMLGLVVGRFLRSTDRTGMSSYDDSYDYGRYQPGRGVSRSSSYSTGTSDYGTAASRSGTTHQRSGSGSGTTGQTGTTGSSGTSGRSGTSTGQGGSTSAQGGGPNSQREAGERGERGNKTSQAGKATNQRDETNSRRPGSSGSTGARGQGE